tara:strand:+ start:54151 stop:55755 length:1605 start_codon:yes stop_codon:yes gene_type:complete
MSFRSGGALGLLLLALFGPPVSAQGAKVDSPPQGGTGDQPLSVIDWLENKQSVPRRPPAAPVGLPNRREPATAVSASAPVVTVTPLGEGAPREIGLVPSTVTGLPADIWRNSTSDQIITLIEDLPDPHIPAAQALLYTVLLAEAQAPKGLAREGDALALARVQKLRDLGALDPALSLIEQAGVATSTAHFDLWMQIALLTGTEDRACARLVKSPHLTREYGTRIFCSARIGNWDNAALTFGSAQALGLMSEEQLDLFDRFLNPDLFEGAAPLRAPRKMDPMTFRLFETIGEPLPSGTLPRAYAVADLRDLSGWKAQLEAAERLTRAGALPDNHLLGLYTDRAPAASGGIWDRVEALQRFETALGTKSVDAVTKTLPNVWRAMQEAELEVAFATLFADQLSSLPLHGRAAAIAFDVALLSPGYEAAANSPAASEASAARALHIAVARGEAPEARPDDAMAEAIWTAFTTPVPRADLMDQARDGQLGVAVLRLLALMDDGANGDSGALRDALATLRALGLEDTARRASLQILLLQR